MKQEILHDMFNISQKLQHRVLQYDRTLPADWYQQIDLLSRLIRVFCDDAEFLSLYAFILEQQQQDMSVVEQYYLKAIETDPTHALSLSRYARFLDFVKREYDQAEHYYHLAIEADPHDAETLNRYAVFLYIYSCQS